MKYTIPLILLAATGCQTLGIPTPWLSGDEVVEVADEVAIQRVDELEVAVEAVVGEEITREMGAAPPVRGTDWGEIITLLLTALGGSAGALGYRALDHRKKRMEAAKQV